MAWEVEFWESPRGWTVLEEDCKKCTREQMAAIHRNLKRLETHGPNLGATYFDTVKSSEEICEFRLTANRVEIRMLYVLEGTQYFFLRVFVHKKSDDVDHHAKIAERRLKEWRDR